MDVCPSEARLMYYVDGLDEEFTVVLAHLITCEVCLKKVRSMRVFSEKLEFERELAALEKADTLNEICPLPDANDDNDEK